MAFHVLLIIMSVAIDDYAVYVPGEYVGKKILVVKKGKKPRDSHTLLGKVVAHHEKYGFGGCIRHRDIKDDLILKKGITYDVWQWYPREFIGYATYHSKIQSSKSTETTTLSSTTDTWDDKAWWEFGQSYENPLKSFFLFPFRLVINLVRLIFIIPFEILKFTAKVIASTIILIISIIILLPLKTVAYLLSFGYLNGFEDKFIDKLDDIWY
jgi:hypothetical protein